MSDSKTQEDRIRGLLDELVDVRRRLGLAIAENKRLEAALDVSTDQCAELLREHSPGMFGGCKGEG